MNHNDIDPAAVWARVYAQSNTTPEPPPLSHNLADWIPAEQQAAVTYYHMARMAGTDGPQLRHMAQECAGHSRKLSALYYFLTGKRPSGTLPDTVPTLELPAMLSDRYRAELTAAECYQTAAAKHPKHSEVLILMADTCRQHARQLLELAEKHI